MLSIEARRFDDVRDVEIATGRNRVQFRQYSGLAWKCVTLNVSRIYISEAPGLDYATPGRRVPPVQRGSYGFASDI
jgi:hypothetical protein